MWMEYCRSFFSREIVPLNFFFTSASCFQIKEMSEDDAFSIKTGVKKVSPLRHSRAIDD